MFCDLLLTLGLLLLVCNPQWPVSASYDESGQWCPDPAPNPHLSVQAAPELSTQPKVHQTRWHIGWKTQKCHLQQTCTLPLLMFSEQARVYMGIPITTSSQACTAPALHCDMHVVRVSSACCRRSSCSSPSDRLCCVRLSVSGLFRRRYVVAYRRVQGQRDTQIKEMTHLETI